MKSVRFIFIKKRFDDQYTFDLQNNLTMHDFHLIVGLFNQAAHLKPPPGSKSIWILTLMTLWFTVTTCLYLLWNQSNHYLSLFCFLFPTCILSSSFLMIWLYRYKRIKFEENILEICGRLNATENIRGINFRFIKNNTDVTREKIQSLSGVKSNYAIDIEIDDRFNVLKSSRFNQRSTSEDDLCYISPPKSVHMNQHYSNEKDTMFQDSPPPSWSPLYK